MSGFLDGTTNTQFAQTFRKANSCDHCRKQKQKCSFATPLSQTCIKCSEAGIECHITPRLKRTVKKKKDQGRFAWLEKRPVKSQFDRGQKIDQLKNVIKEAQEELDSMQPFSTAATRAAAVAQIGGEFNGRTLVEQAISMGLFNHLEAKNSMSRFVDELGWHLMFSLDLPSECVKFDSSQSILALAIILAFKVTTESDPMSELQQFLEQLIIERIFINPQPSLYIIKALILLNMFVRATDDSKIPTYILLAHAAAVQLDLGSAEDIHGLRSTDKPRQKYAQERCRVFLSLTTAISHIGMNTSRLAMLDLLPDNTRLRTAFQAAGDTRDQILAYSEYLFVQGKNSVQALQGADKRDKPFDSDIKPVIDCIELKFDDIVKRVDNLREGFPLPADGPEVHSFSACSGVVLLNVFETALNNVVFNSAGVDYEAIDYLSQKIINLSNSLINGFVSLRQRVTAMPAFQYLKPLHAVCAGIRLRLLLWTQGIFDTHVPVEESVRLVKSNWGNQGSYAADTMRETFEKMERWSFLRMQDWTGCCASAMEGGPSPTVVMLQKILRDGGKVAHGHTAVGCANSGQGSKSQQTQFTQEQEEQQQQQQQTQNGQQMQSDGDSNSPRVEYNGYTVNDMFSIVPNEGSMLDDTLDQFPDLTVHNESPSTTPPSSSTSTYSPSNLNVEQTLKDIFSELGSSIYVDE